MAQGRGLLTTESSPTHVLVQGRCLSHADLTLVPNFAICAGDFHRTLARRAEELSPNPSLPQDVVAALNDKASLAGVAHAAATIGYAVAASSVS